MGTPALGKQCSSCGATLRGDTKYCGNCGAKMNRQPSPQESLVNLHEYQQAQPAKGKAPDSSAVRPEDKDAIRWWQICALCLLGLISVVVLGQWLLHNAQRQAQQTKQEVNESLEQALGRVQQERQAAEIQKRFAGVKKTSVTTADGNFDFYNVHIVLNSRGQAYGFAGDVVNSTSKNWQYVVFKEVAFDIKGTALSTDSVRIETMHRGESREVYFAFSQLLNSKSIGNNKLTFDSGEYLATYNIVMLRKPSSILTVLGLSKPSDYTSWTEGPLTFDDGKIRIAFAFGEKQIGFKLANHTDLAAELDWNRMSYIDSDGSAHKIIHSGVKYIARDTLMPPSTIPPQASMEDVVLPIENVSYAGGDWREKEMFPTSYSSAKQLQGNIVGLLLPIKFGVNNPSEYDFRFKIAKVQPD